MAKEIECPMCEADIPLDGDEKPGELVLCSFCKSIFKVVRKKDKLILAEDFED